MRIGGLRAFSKFSGLLGKSFAEEFFRLLLAYRSVSASEAASRLNLHVKTAQDFLEGLEELGIVSKQKVFEKKRPYFRFALERESFEIKVDLRELPGVAPPAEFESVLIREKKNSGCVFKASPRTGLPASVIFYTGKGRAKREWKVSLTENQGRFLYHLPFPTEAPAGFRAVLEKAGIEPAYEPEVSDIVRFLGEHGIIEISG